MGLPPRTQRDQQVLSSGGPGPSPANHIAQAALPGIPGGASGPSQQATASTAGVLSGTVLEARFQQLSPEEQVILTNALTPEVGAIVKKLLDPSCAECVDLGVNTPPRQAGSPAPRPSIAPGNRGPGGLTEVDVATARSPLRQLRANS